MVNEPSGPPDHLHGVQSIENSLGWPRPPAPLSRSSLRHCSAEVCSAGEGGWWLFLLCGRSHGPLGDPSWPPKEAWAVGGGVLETGQGEGGEPGTGGAMRPGAPGMPYGDLTPDRPQRMGGACLSSVIRSWLITSCAPRHSEPEPSSLIHLSGVICDDGGPWRALVLKPPFPSVEA